jgi:hypothetical protein
MESAGVGSRVDAGGSVAAPIAFHSLRQQAVSRAIPAVCLPGVTTIDNGEVAERPSSICYVSVTMQLAFPNALSAGAKLSRPVASTAGLTANNPVGAAVQLTVKASGSDSPGSAEMLVAQAALYAPESSATVTVAGLALNDGGWLTARHTA